MAGISQHLAVSLSYKISISSTNKNAGLPAPPCHFGSLLLLMITSTWRAFTGAKDISWGYNPSLSFWVSPGIFLGCYFLEILAIVGYLYGYGGGSHDPIAFYHIRIERYLLDFG